MNYFIGVQALGFDYFNPFAYLKELINIIPKIVYYLCVAAMSLLDAGQLVLRKMAGLDVYYVGESATEQTGDIALSFIRGIFETNSQYPALKNAFWALVVLGIILIIVTSIISTIRQEYMPGDDEAKEKPTNSKAFVLKRAFKSLTLFFIVPVSIIFGLMFSDIFLRAIDSATTANYVGGTLLSKESVKEKLVAQEIYGGGVVSYTYMDLFGFAGPATATTTFSGMAFKAGAYTANRIRINNTYAVTVGANTTSMSYFEILTNDGDLLSNFDIFNQALDSSEAAQMIDEAFANNVKLKNPENLIVDTDVAENFSSTMIFTTGEQVEHFSKFNVSLVWYFYDLWYFNFLIAFAFLIITLKLMVKIVVGLMRRIIEMVALFIISPPVISIMPLDNGKAFGEWRKNFISKALSAYGAIIGMNLFFLILPYLNEINFFSQIATSQFNAQGAIDMINLIISTLFVITGLIVVESFIDLLSGIVGGENVAKTGGEYVGKIGDQLQKSGKYVGAAAGFATRVATAPITIPAKLTGFDKKVAGVANQVSSSIKRGVGFNKKERNKIRADYENKWNENDASTAYENYLSGNQKYNSNINDLFKESGSKMPFEKWKETDEGKIAKDKAILNLNLQNFADFKEHKSGEGEKIFEREVTKKMDEETPTYKKAFSKRGEAIKNTAVGDEMMKLGKNLSAYASNFPILATDAFERNNKQGLKSMIMAFKGASAKEIELEEVYSKIKDEEMQKATVQQEEREKQRKKEEEKQKKQVEQKLEEQDKKIKNLTEESNKDNKKG